MASLNTQIAQLQQLKPGSGKNGKAEEHNANVVVMLQGRLANASMGFKDVLETRTSNMKAARERGQVFGDSAPMASQQNSAFAGPSGRLPAQEPLPCCTGHYIRLTLRRAAVPEIACGRFTSLQHWGSLCLRPQGQRSSGGLWRSSATASRRPASVRLLGFGHGRGWRQHAVDADDGTRGEPPCSFFM